MRPASTRHRGTGRRQVLAQFRGRTGPPGRLRIGETTVKTHVSRVLTKLDLRSRVQAAILAREADLVTDTR